MLGKGFPSNPAAPMRIQMDARRLRGVRHPQPCSAEPCSAKAFPAIQSRLCVIGLSAASRPVLRLPLPAGQRKTPLLVAAGFLV